MVSGSDIPVAEFLVRCGRRGEIGRFRCARPGEAGRGDLVVVRGEFGLERGVLLRPLSPRLDRLVPGPVGELLRRARPADDDAADRMGHRGQELLTEGRRAAVERGLAVELLDADVTLDGQRALVQYVQWQAGELHPLIEHLARRFEVEPIFQDLTRRAADGGCGQPDCGQGGCGSCGTGGGCATGCGSADQAREVRDYFAALRRDFESRQRRPLL